LSQNFYDFEAAMGTSLPKKRENSGQIRSFRSRLG